MKRTPARPDGLEPPEKITRRAAVQLLGRGAVGLTAAAAFLAGCEDDAEPEEKPAAGEGGAPEGGPQTTPAETSSGSGEGTSGTTPERGKVRKIDPDVCIDCGACMSECPSSAIRQESGRYVIDSAKCVGCGTCQGVCPVEAIKVP